MLLIDYLEDASHKLGKKKEKLSGLSRQYKKLYSKDIRQEMQIIRAEIRSLNHEINETLYEALHELALIRTYFPELYNVFIEDPAIGKLIRKKEWLLGRTKMTKKKAEDKLMKVKDQRTQLLEARKFVQKWPREQIDAKSINATWPVLKEQLSGELDKEDVLEAIAEKDRELKHSGWLVLLDDSMIQDALDRFSQKIKRSLVQEREKAEEAENARGKGSVKEYETAKELEAASAKRKNYERKLKHLLLANREFLIQLKKNGKWDKKNSCIKDLVIQIPLNKINDKEWVKEMKKRLEA